MTEDEAIADIMNLLNLVLKNNHKLPDDITKEDYMMLTDAFNAGFGYAIEKYTEVMKKPVES